MKDSTGFTLVELMITLALAAILLAVAVPSYRSFVQSNRTASQANTVLRALAYTRSEAIKRAETVTICQSSNQSTCGGDKTAWESGWIVFSDIDQDGTLDSKEALLQVGNGLSGDSTLTAGKSFISYAASGAVVDEDTTQFTLTPADCQGDMQRLIKVIASGQTTLQKASCS